MIVPGRRDQVAILARRLHQIIATWIDQLAHDTGSKGFARALFTGPSKDRIWPGRPQSSQGPQNHDPPFALALDRQQVAQRLQRAARDRTRQFTCAPGPQDRHGPAVNDAPTAGTDLYRSPFRVAPIEVELPTILVDAQPG